MASGLIQFAFVLASGIINIMPNESGPIYIPEQYKTLNSRAKKTGKPYTVIEMTHNMFYEVKALQESWATNFNIDEEENLIKWHDIKILRVEKEHPEEFFYKTSFAEEALAYCIVGCKQKRRKNVIPKS
ncbi:hypothetical protein ACJJTC_017813 [Scirpophaga incertulas]